MTSAAVASILECLSSPIRLDAYRMLVRAAPDGLVAGEIGSNLGLPPSNLSFHLRAMSQTGLVSVQQEGRFLRYRADLALMNKVVGYLSAECCGGHPELCAPVSKAKRSPK